MGKLQESSVLLATCIVEPKSDTENPVVPVKLMNLSSKGVTIYKGTRVGLANALEGREIFVANISESEPVSQGEISVTKQQLLWQATEMSTEDLTQAQCVQLCSAFRVCRCFCRGFCRPGADRITTTSH